MATDDAVVDRDVARAAGGYIEDAVRRHTLERLAGEGIDALILAGVRVSLGLALDRGAIPANHAAVALDSLAWVAANIFELCPEEHFAGACRAAARQYRHTMPPDPEDRATWKATVCAEVRSRIGRAR